MLRHSPKLLAAIVVAVAILGCDLNNSSTGSSGSPPSVGPADTSLPGSASKLITSTNFGSNYSDTISAGGIDWYRIKVQKDSVYNVTCIGGYSSVTGTSTDTKISILASGSATVMAFNDDAGTGSDPSVTFKAPDSGYVRIKIEGGKASTTGTYKLIVVQQDTYEPDDYFSKATLLLTDSTVQAHVIGGTDKDVFKLNVQAGKLYKISVLNTITMYAYGYGADTTGSATFSTSLYSSTSTPNTLVLEPTATGVYYFRVQSYSTSSAKAVYKIAATASVGDIYEPDNGITKAVVMTAGATPLNRYLAVSDVDWFKFVADSGKYYTASLPTNPFNSASTSFLTADSAVVSSAQTNLSSYGGGSFACAKSGTYYFKVSSSYTGLYSVALTVTTTTPSWYTASDAYENDNSLSKASMLKPDSSVARHTLASGDEDWTKVPVDSGKTYQFNVINTGDYDCTFYLYSADSILITTNSTIAESGETMSSQYTARRATEVYVRISNSSWGTNYGLSVEPAPTDSFELDNTQATAKALPIDSVYRKHLLPGGDIDWLVMRTVAGKTYEVYCTASSPYMYFYDKLGNTLSRTSLSTLSGLAYAVVAKDTLTYVTISSSSSTSSLVNYAIAAVQTPADSFEPDNFFGKAPLLPTDSTVQSHSTDGADIDCIKLNVQVGKLYKVSIQANYSMYAYGYGPDTTASYLQYWSISSVSSSYSMPTTFTIEPSATGAYYLKLSMSYSSPVRGWYRIAVTEAVSDTYEPDNGLALASTVTVGVGTQSRYLAKSDVDWFKFTADSGKFYSVSFPTNPFSSVATTFYTADSATVPSAQTSVSSYSGGTFACTKSGTYYFRVSSYYTGVYTVSMTSTTTIPSWYSTPDAYEPDNKLSTASVLKPDSSVARHTLVYGDDDWTKIAVDSGKTYVFSVKNTGSYSCYFYLYSADSAMIVSGMTASYGTTMSSVYTARRATDVYVRIAASSSGTSYQLTVQPAPTDTFESDNTLGTAKTLATDGLPQNRVLYGSEDWIKIRLDSAGSYQIRTENLGASATFYSEIYSADSALLASLVSTTTNSAYTRTYKTTKAADIYVRVYSSYSNTYVTPYTILARREPTDTFEIDNGLSMAKPIVPGAVAQYHLLSSADEDWVSFPIDSGYTYTVSAKSMTTDYLSLYLYTADSASISSQTYSSAPSVLTVGRRKTTYYAKVTPYYSSVTTPFGYEISVKAVAPVAIVAAPL